MLSFFKKKIDRLLENLNQYLSLDLPYFVKGGFWLFSGQIINLALLFVLSIVFARRLTQEVYGQYNYLISVFTTLSLFSLPGLDTAVTQAVARNYEKDFYTGFLTKLKWGLLGGMFSFLIGLYFYLQQQYQLAFALFLGVLFVPLMYAGEIYASFLTGRKLFKQNVKYMLISQLFSICAIMATLWLTSSLLALVFVFLLTQFLTNTFFYFFTKANYRPNKKSDPQTIKFGKNLSILRGFEIFASYLDRFIIFHLFGPVELAIYAFALRPIQQLSGLFNNLSPLILPRFARRSIKEINLKFSTRVSQLLLIGVVTSGFYLLGAPFLFKIFFPRYIDSIGYSKIFGLSLVLGGVSPFLAAVFRAKKLTRSLFISGFSTHILLIVLIFLLGSSWGIKGVILAKLAVPFYSFFLSLILWKKAVGR